MAAPGAIVWDSVFKNILSIFPQRFAFVFAYGSGVFAQAGQDLSHNKMLDFVITVDDPLSWHTQNLEVNKRHYSIIRMGGPRLISRLQQDFGAGIYFNTLVPFENKLFKYGVISTNSLMLDLLDWETLYVSGRLHKPVRILYEPQDLSLKEALKVNLRSALHTSLLCLPESFTEEELYLHLAGLSYSGDIRMIVGEDKNKISNIVKPQKEQFRQLYKPYIQSLGSLLNWDESKGVFEQDCSKCARFHHLNLLPKQVQYRLVLIWNRDGRNRDTEEVLRLASQDIDCPYIIIDIIKDIVRWSSFRQSCKGVASAGKSSHTFVPTTLLTPDRTLDMRGDIHTYNSQGPKTLFITAV